MEPQDAFYVWHDEFLPNRGEIEVGWGCDEYEAGGNSFTFPREELEALIEFLEEQLTMQSSEEEDAA
jgi:hypothetical protein